MTNPTTPPEIAERCQQCGGRDRISNGPTALICSRCHDATVIDNLEAQVRELQSKLDGQMGPWWIQDMDKLQAELQRENEDASWARVHRSELLDLRSAFAKSEADNVELQATMESLSAPMQREEEAQYGDCGARFAFDEIMQARLERKP